MVEIYCPICETQHEVEIIENGVDNGIEWVAYRCNLTTKEFERWTNHGGTRLRTLVPGRRICLMSEQSPSTAEPISANFAFDLDSVDRVSSMFTKLAPLQKGVSQQQYLSQLIEILAQNLKPLFVGIYLIDSDENWLSFQAGNHELISKILSKHAAKYRIMDHRYYFGQAGAAIYANDIRLVHWTMGYIIAYKIENGHVSETTVKNYSELFESPWYGDTQLYFPLQNGPHKIGVLEFAFNTSPHISHIELRKVQGLANQIARVLSEDESAG